MTAPDRPFRVTEYRLALDIDFATMRWTGTIDFEVLGTGASIDLDAVKLEIREARVDGTAVPFEIDAARQRLRLLAGVDRHAAVHVAFAGAVDPATLMGLYRSKFGPTYILTSQCEAAAARQIFPCFDRPDAKAPIVLTVRTQKEQEVVSNMPPTSVVVDGDRTRWTFDRTPPMATYLFYLGIGVFERLEEMAGPVRLTVLAPPGRREEGRKALEVTRTALAELESYYRLPYPLPKLDLIAVPEFPFGAMENWGAITFRDMQLLINPATPAFEMRYTVATIVHEIAHQWFGNLVTPFWWTDIWLNESFATFVEHKVVEKRYPELESEQDFLSIWTRWGFLLDSLRNNHPIVVDVGDPSEIAIAIDRLTYGKGASVLRMIEGYLGEARFQSGVADYLRQHAGGNATSQDLWEALDRSTGEPVTRILRPWVETAGHPVVSAQTTPAGIELRQRPFGFLPNRSNAVWPIPMVIEIDGRPQRILFETPHTVVPAPPDATIHLNPGALGFYRSLYDPELYDRLLVGFDRRRPSDRWSVLEDLWAFLLSGDTTLAQYGRFARALDAATDYLSVGSTAAHLETLFNWAGDLPGVADLVRGFAAVHSERLGLEARAGESSTTGSLRESVQRTRVRSDPGFARRLAQRFDEWDRLDANVRMPTVLAYASTGGEAAYRAIRERLAAAVSQTEAVKFEIALASSNDPRLVEATFDLGLAGGINKGNFPVVLTAAAANPAAREVEWPWLERHLPDLVERYGGTSILTDFLDLAVPSLGLAHPTRVRGYFRDHPMPSEAKTIARALEMLEVAEGVRRRLGGGPTASG